MSVSLPPTRGKRIKSLETAFTIIERLGDGGPSSLAQLARDLSYSKSTIHYYLRTLGAERYVVETEEGYRLGLRCLELGGRALEQFGFSRVVAEEVDRLADETGQTAVVAVEEGGTCVYVYRAWPDAENPVDCPIGAEHLLHTTGPGKAILAHLDEADLQAILEYHGLPKRTDNTITEPETLYEELQRTRVNEIAFDDGECVAGVRSIGAPLIEPDGGVFGAVGILGTESELDDPYVHTKAKRFEETPSNMVKRFSHIIRHKLGAD